MSCVICEKLAIRSHALDTDEHLSAGGIVVELNFRLALAVCFHIGLPVERTSEVLHRWNDRVVLHLEGLALAVTFEVRASQTFLLEVILGMSIDKHNSWIDGEKVIRNDETREEVLVVSNIDRLDFVNESRYSHDTFKP